MDDQEKYDILKKEVDTLQIQLSKDQKPWYQNLSIIISIIALVFSFGTTGVSYYRSHVEDVRANRKEVRELIQRITKLPIENFELMQKNKGSVLGESLSGMINEENIILASQAYELIKRYPGSFTSSEYFSIAHALSQSNIMDDVPFLLEEAIKRAKNYNEYNVSTRAYAWYFFLQGIPSEGRKYYEMALSVWDKFPEKNQYIIHSVDLLTLRYWSLAEASINNFPEAANLITRAKDCLKKLPHGPNTESLGRQIAELEKIIKLGKPSQKIPVTRHQFPK